MVDMHMIMLEMNMLLQDPLMEKTIRDYGLPDNSQRNNNPATESLLAPVHITKDYYAKTAVPMLKDHEQSPQRNIQGNSQKPEFSNKKYRKACKFINTPEGCKMGSRCLFRHETYNQQRPNKRMKLGSVDSHISTDASCKINKPSGWRMAVHDDDFPADDDDESSLHSSYHISTDASWKINRPSGLGVSIKDSNGHLLEAWCDCKRDVPSSLVAEGFALRWALSESLQRNWDNIHIFSDCKTLVDCINGATRCPSSCKVVYDDIILLKSNFRSCVFSFVPRSYNVHAHILAHIGTSLTKKVCVKVQ